MPKLHAGQATNTYVGTHKDELLFKVSVEEANHFMALVGQSVPVVLGRDLEVDGLLHSITIEDGSPTATLAVYIDVNKIMQALEEEELRGNG